MLRWAKRFACGILALALVLAAVGAWVAWLAHTRLPKLDGEIRHASLKGPVEVVRDEWGVPHIRAQEASDAYFALGYTVAQDRLFQMEALRRIAGGELAEIFGPPAVSPDKIARSFCLWRKAEETWRNLAGQHPELAALAEAYCAGINHFQDNERLPFEFAVLNIPKRHYTPVDSLVVAAILPVTLADALRIDPLAALLQERCPGKPVMDLFPGYDFEDKPTTIMETPEEAAGWAAARRAARPSAQAQALPAADRQSMAALHAWLDPLMTLTRNLSPALGSNSWVLSPAKTVSGKALLANDPHIGFTNPSVWYEAHLEYGDTSLYGLYFPLIPMALIGTTPKLSWGLTMYSNDDVDFYRETFDPANPNRVMYKGKYVDCQVQTERIKVRFGPDVECPIRITPHGPVVTDLIRLLHDHKGPDISMFWVWQQVDYTDLLALYKMNTAQDYNDFADAMPLVTSPGLNISYADTEGNIAWWAAGRVMLRPPHVWSKTILDGASGKDEFLGFAPFEDSPHLKNPAGGYIATANNLPTVQPVGGQLLEGYWQPLDRAQRIEQCLEAKDKWGVADTAALQMDDYAVTADRVMEEVLPLLDDYHTRGTRLEKEVYELLAAWDKTHAPESAGALAYQYLCDAIISEALLDEMDEKLYDDYTMNAERWSFFRQLVRDPENVFWDRIGTPERETRKQVVSDAFGKCVAVLRRNHGDAVKQWRWGDAHTITFTHPFGYVPLLGRFFNIGPMPSPGADHTINNMISMGRAGNYEIIAGPSTRRVVDYGGANGPDMRLILPTGNSGNLCSPHYDDQARMFVKGGVREAHLTNAAIDEHRAHTLWFKPAR